MYTTRSVNLGQVFDIPKMVPHFFPRQYEYQKALKKAWFTSKSDLEQALGKTQAIATGTASMVRDETPASIVRYLSMLGGPYNFRDYFIALASGYRKIYEARFPTAKVEVVPAQPVEPPFSVVSAPPGAKIIIDGTDTGMITPFYFTRSDTITRTADGKINQITPGRHTITVEREYYHRDGRTVIVAPGTSGVHFRLERMWEEPEAEPEAEAPWLTLPPGQLPPELQVDVIPIPGQPKKRREPTPQPAVPPEEEAPWLTLPPGVLPPELRKETPVDYEYPTDFPKTVGPVPEPVEPGVIVAPVPKQPKQLRRRKAPVKPPPAPVLPPALVPTPAAPTAAPPGFAVPPRYDVTPDPYAYLFAKTGVPFPDWKVPSPEEAPPPEEELPGYVLPPVTQPAPSPGLPPAAPLLPPAAPRPPTIQPPTATAPPPAPPMPFL